ncbi:MAG: hypothetical protein K2O78_05315 [Muribaculaceae bacterium]|nr:hypothetical protein [Muribaculaceae bacterium]
MKHTAAILPALILIIGTAAVYTRQTTRTLPAALTPEEISWVAFCNASGYDPHTTDPEIINEFLDTWRGSSLEETALSKHGINYD